MQNLSINNIIIKLICVEILCLKVIQTEVVFRESLEGSVDSGNYSYFSYNGNYKIKLVLKSLTGDADLYVSQSDVSGRTVKPNFDFSGHDLQSVTCGDDSIEVPEDYVRPIGIGVYGHPNYATTHFTLDVIAFEDDYDYSKSNSYISEEELNFYEEFFGERYEGFNKVPKHRINSAKSDRKRDNSNGSADESHSDTWDFIINLLANILHILLEAVL